MIEARSLSRRDWLILVVFSLAIFLPGIASLSPTDRDESRYIVTSSRMADTGEIVDLRFQDKPRYLQPAGIYWLQAAATTVFDSPAHDSIWAYRIPSALGALFAVLMTGALGALFFGRKAGLAAAVLLAACFSLNFEARIAKIDAALLASVVAAQFALMRAYVEPRVGRATAALFWIALGVGVMLKGPLVLLVSGSTIAALAIWDRKVAWLRNLRPAWGPLLTLAIALPWFIAIGVTTDGAFYERALMRNFLGKVGAGEQGHSGPPGYHLALFMLAFWPGSLLAFRAVGHTWRERAEPAVRFLMCWIIPTWIIFEFVATKLPHYVLPTYPAIAILAAAALFSPGPAPVTRTRRIVFGVVAGLWLLASGLVASLAPALLWRTQGGPNAIAIGLAVLGFAAAIAALWMLRRGRPMAVAGALGAAGLLVWCNTFGYVLPRLHDIWMSPRIAEAARTARPCPTSVLVSTPYKEPSLVFLYGRERTLFSAISGADAAQAMAASPGCGLALVGADERSAFLARAAELGLDPRPADRIVGQNYSNGDKLDLTLYVARAAPRPEAADAPR